MNTDGCFASIHSSVKVDVLKRSISQDLAQPCMQRHKHTQRKEKSVYFYLEDSCKRPVVLFNKFVSNINFWFLSLLQETKKLMQICTKQWKSQVQFLG